MRAPTFLMLAFALALTSLCATVLAESQAAPPYLVIVNPQNAVTSVDRQFLEGAFLKKITRWQNDEVVHPADLVASSPVRRRFSEDVLNRSVEAVKGYWQQRIFSGRDVPPPEFETDDEVVKYVLKYPGSIGYVAANANLSGAKVVAVK